MLLRRVAQAVSRLELRGRSVLVAVSGGLDSVALLHALHALAEKEALKLSIGHVNHGLRGEESEADQRFVEALGEGMGLPVHAARVAPAERRQGGPSRDRPTLQEAARELRYAALRELAEKAGAERIATAHQLDDQAETLLLRLLRGTGPDGLAGIPERSPDGCIVRPFLGVERAEIERFARERRLSWCDDASNGCLDYARNRLRQRWLPGLAGDFNPKLLRALGNLAEAQRRDSEWIEAWVEQEAAARLSEVDGWLAIEAKDWAALPPALSRRLARRALARCGAGRLASRVHLERMQAFLGGARTGRFIELPDGLVLRRGPDGYRLGPLRPPGDSRDAC